MMQKKIYSILFVLVMGHIACLGLYAQEAEPARAEENGQAVAEKPKDEAQKSDLAEYDLSALPDDLRVKVESYLQQQSKLEKEIQRMDAMVQASSNSWAQQRATGMATKLNYELKNLRLQRREIIRDYRELLRSGWTPPESMDNFESLFFTHTGEASNS